MLAPDNDSRAKKAMYYLKQEDDRVYTELPPVEKKNMLGTGMDD